MANNYHFDITQQKEWAAVRFTIEFQNRDLYILLIKKKTSVVNERFFYQKVSATTFSWWPCYVLQTAWSLSGPLSSFESIPSWSPPSVHEPLRNSAEFCGIYHYFCTFLYFFTLEFSFEDIWNSVYTNLYGIPRNFGVLYRNKKFAELCEIKSILCKIPYSAEFQKGTSENTPLRPLT